MTAKLAAALVATEQTTAALLDRALVSLRAAATAPLPTPAVLVVDDDPEYLEAAMEILGTLRVEVVGFTDPSEALAALRRRLFAVALIDLHLGPRAMTGIELANALDRRTRLILVTGTVPAELPALAIRARADAYFTKPPDTDALLACVRRLLAC